MNMGGGERQTKRQTLTCREQTDGYLAGGVGSEVGDGDSGVHFAAMSTR